ncbi:MAG TPA: carboxypeptidase regulatory-like domain-containing protein, partial [Thermoplasmatales archaeon]|nr:carboxypeptidase regulatory-like domain-containing protein [Thermoplasmatales archaeon]
MKKHSNKSLTLFLTLMMMLTAFVTPPVNGHSSTRTDIPTWYQGDSWTYEGTVWGEGTNWSIDATIQDLKNLVTGIVTVTENGEEYECYQVEITGTIKGNFTWDILSGEIDGVIEGTSYYRISDLAQVKTHIHSYGEVDMPLPLDYEYNSTNTFNPPLENFDFPIKVGEQWEISSQVTTESHFYLEGLYDETSSNTSWVNKTLECTKKQTVKTPAGSFNSFLITNPNDEADDSLFYSPKAGNIVKGEVYYSDENNSFEAHINLKTYSRKTQPLTITETLFPLEFIQGEEVKISGKITNSETGEPIKNTVISIEIPATEETYHTTTDDNGNYEKTITPHVIQDHTPSTIEIGSDGVIVKCTKGSLTGYRVKTLVSIDHNTPPKKPMYINGVTKGYANETYSYSTSTYDLNYDQLYYLFDWGDGSNGSWV